MIDWIKRKIKAILAVFVGLVIGTVLAVNYDYPEPPKTDDRQSDIIEDIISSDATEENDVSSTTDEKAEEEKLQEIKRKRTRRSF